MPRKYIKKGSRTGEVDEDAMKSAMDEVLNKTLSIRKSAQKYGMKPTTLHSRLTNLKKKLRLNIQLPTPDKPHVYFLQNLHRTRCSLPKKRMC